MAAEIASQMDWLKICAFSNHARLIFCKKQGKACTVSNINQVPCILKDENEKKGCGEEENNVSTDLKV